MALSFETRLGLGNLPQLAGSIGAVVIASRPKSMPPWGSPENESGAKGTLRDANPGLWSGALAGRGNRLTLRAGTHGKGCGWVKSLALADLRRAPDRKQRGKPVVIREVELRRSDLKREHAHATH
jgi:hypothetical protein